MDESKRDPREDISLIRQIMERAMDGMKTIAPWFRAFGLAWLVYSLWQSFCFLLPQFSWLLFAGGTTEDFVNGYETIGQISEILHWVYLACITVMFWLCRRRLAPLGKDAPARKLLDMWGVCMFLYLGVGIVAFNLTASFADRYITLPKEAEKHLRYTINLCNTVLYYLFPVAPLLMTAAFLRSRPMFLVGLVLAVLAALNFGGYCLDSLMSYNGVTLNMELFAGIKVLFAGVIIALQLAPGVMLLVFGRLVRGR